MIRLIVHGAGGKMGQTICSKVCTSGDELTLAAEVDARFNAPEGRRFCELSGVTEDADCVIDFSVHSAVGQLLDYCVARALPVVIATTGHTEEEKKLIRDASEKIPVFLSANMSVGVAFLAEIGKRAASLFPDADIEIVECHHNQKLDVPSGTALMLADRIGEARTDARFVVGRHENGKRDAHEIGIHSLRLGGKVGTHEIYISTGSETIVLRHEAENRALFADGALAAVRFLVRQKPGLYDMRDMLRR